MTLMFIMFLRILLNYFDKLDVNIFRTSYWDGKQISKIKLPAPSERDHKLLPLTIYCIGIYIMIRK